MVQNGPKWLKVEIISNPFVNYVKCGSLSNAVSSRINNIEGVLIFMYLKHNAIISRENKIVLKKNFQWHYVASLEI